MARLDGKVVIVTGAAGLVLEGAARAWRARVVVAHDPAAAVPRPRGRVLSVPEVASVRDFDAVGGRLYVLDPLLAAVHLNA